MRFGERNTEEYRISERRKIAVTRRTRSPAPTTVGRETLKNVPAVVVKWKFFF